jgi:hypothetical protein
MGKLVVLPFIILFIAGWAFIHLLYKLVQIICAAALAVVLFLFIGVAAAFKNEI